MNAKEKAKELVGKMKSSLFSDGYYDAKQCALIVVEEIIDLLPSIATTDDYEINSSHLEYWKEVKQEINNL